MIKLTAFILRCWWWVYYAAWNAGEWIVTNPNWLTRHAFQMLVFANFPLVFNLLSFLGSPAQDQVPDHDPFNSLSQIADFFVNATPVIFWIDTIVIMGLVVVWFAHMVLSLFAKE